MRSKVSDLLDKINRIANQPSFPQVSGMEFDLLMQHLRDLYEELDTVRSAKVEIANRVEAVELEAVELFQIEPINLKEERKEEVVVIKKKEEQAAIKTETKFFSSKSSINEIVQSPESLNSKSKASSKEVHHKLSTKPLKELLDLNKRFVIANELFKDNADAFTKTIEQIDSAKDYESAANFIRSQLVDVHQWDESSETFKLFLKLVKQKFGAE